MLRLCHEKGKRWDGRRMWRTQSHAWGSLMSSANMTMNSLLQGIQQRIFRLFTKNQQILPRIRIFRLSAGKGAANHGKTGRKRNDPNNLGRVFRPTTFAEQGICREKSVPNWNQCRPAKSAAALKRSAPDIPAPQTRCWFGEVDECGAPTSDQGRSARHLLLQRFGCATRAYDGRVSQTPRQQCSN